MNFSNASDLPPEDDQNVTKVVGPLTYQDIIAGCSLLSYGIVGLLLYGCVALALYILARKLNGFIILFSEAIANMLLIFQFGFYTGLLILLQNDPLPLSSRLPVAVICDFFWFAMAQHYPLIAWSRLMAIKWPMWFKFFKHKNMVYVCLFFWCWALIQSTALRFTSWYVLFYFDPINTYGMTTADWGFYSDGGTDYFWNAYHGIMIFAPLGMYGVTIAILLQQKNAVKPAETTKGEKKKESRSLSVEKRLLIPCCINSVVYLLSKIAFNESNFNGKWGSWFYSFMFLTNSFVNPLLLITFSTVVREKTWEVITGKKKEAVSVATNSNMLSPNSATHRRSSVRSAISNTAQT